MLADKQNLEVSNSLKKKFLFENDINSIHLLINIYESENNMGNVFPKYISKGVLRKLILGMLRGRAGKELAAKNISELIHDDFNRLELLIYLEGYKFGLNSNKYVNTAECLLLKDYDLESIYYMSVIKNIADANDEIKFYKSCILKSLRYELLNNDSYKNMIETYSKYVIKPKIFMLNRNLDKQLKMDETDCGKAVIRFEAEPFDKVELSKMYRKIKNLIFKDGIRIFEDAYWSGIIDKVFMRYK